MSNMNSDGAAILKLIQDEMQATPETDGTGRRVDRITRMLIAQMTITNDTIKSHVQWCSKVQLATFILLVFLIGWTIAMHPAIMPYLIKAVTVAVG